METKTVGMTRKDFLAMLCGTGAVVLGDCAQGGETTGTASTSAAGKSAAVLVAYYSATGNTKRVAQAAATALGADLFEIAPVSPYSDDDLDYNDDSSRVSQEYADESKRSVELTQVTPDGFAGYDTVLLGYPIWWGIAAWPTNGFVAGNDFAGKTVIPFCTSISSLVGESATGLESLASGDAGTWTEGQRFDSGASDDEIRTWVSGLAIG
jgi:hypothetical protein